MNNDVTQGRSEEQKNEQIEKQVEQEEQAGEQTEEQEDQEEREEQQTEDQWEELTDIGLEMLQELNHDFKDGSIEQFPYSVTMIAIRRGVADNSRKILRNSDILEHYFDNAIDRLEAGEVGSFFNPDDIVTINVDDDDDDDDDNDDNDDIDQEDVKEEVQESEQPAQPDQVESDQPEPDQPNQATASTLDINDFHRAVEAVEISSVGGTLTKEQLESITTLIDQLHQILSSTEMPTDTVVTDKPHLKPQSKPQSKPHLELTKVDAEAEASKESPYTGIGFDRIQNDWRFRKRLDGKQRTICRAPTHAEIVALKAEWEQQQ